MADTSKGTKRARSVKAVPEGRDTPDDRTTEAPSHEPATCPVAWCPVCLAVTAVQPVNPELVEHLLRAGTEFFLALRSLIDTRADGVTAADRSDTDPDDGDLRKIDIG